MLLASIIISLLAQTAIALPVSRPDLDERDNFSIIRNDLSGACKPVTIIFARGTAELGNVGTFAGPPFFNALGDIIGDDKVAVQGVKYPATIAGYLAGGDPKGASKLAELTNQAAVQCPETQIVLSGYSQGAQVVHLGVRQISPEVAQRIQAVVLFGDPNEGKPLQGIPTGDVVTFCFDTDLICDGKPIVLPAHLSYALNARAAAQFVASNLQI